jgi:hypothetical protein
MGGGALTKEHAGIKLTTMWPGEQGRGRFFPDCRSGGSHRFGAVHFLDSRNVVLRVCRFCDAEKIIEYIVMDGQLRETILKAKKDEI